MRDLWVFLRANGIDAKFDMEAAGRRQDWALWMMQEIRVADFVIVVASPEYKRRAEGDAGDAVGRGVQWEAQLLREELNRAREVTWAKLVPVVLPGGSAADIPVWLGPSTGTHYAVSGFTVQGAEGLLRYLTGQPLVIAGEPGSVPHLPAATIGGAPDTDRGATAPRRGLRTLVVITAEVADGQLRSAIDIAGAPAGRSLGPMPRSAAAAQEAQKMVPALAAARLAEVGRSLVEALFPAEAAKLVGALLDRLPPGDGVDVVLRGDDACLGLPIELLRLPGAGGTHGGALCLRAGATIRREVVGAPVKFPSALPGPVKVLAAVAAPTETKTVNAPLDVEAEMQAVLDAAGSVAEVEHGEVQILEVASLKAIGDALTADAYHVLHLSAHGSANAVELEDEDGDPAEVTSSALIEELRHAGKAIPLIVLSACSGGTAGAKSMGLGLIRQGADRVVAMQAPISDQYATELAASFYRALVHAPTLPVAQLLAHARYEVAQQHARDKGDPERPADYWVPTLFSAASDTGLVDEQQPIQPLQHPMDPPSGGSVRELKVGELIGRRQELRIGSGVLRRTRRAVDDFGATGGVLLAGIGGIGKTAVAGRLLGRLQADGWIVAVHEGVWNPSGILRQVGEAIEKHVGGADKTGKPPTVTADTASALRSDHLDERTRFDLLEQLITRYRILLVFDDFEQNLTLGGRDFLDPSVACTLAGMADAAAANPHGGALLITCRYPLPGDAVDLARIDLPPLSRSELRRMLLRLPAVRKLDSAERAILVRSIGGHPRLIEFVDALLRRGRSNNPHVKKRIRQLADRANLSVAGMTSVRDAVKDAAKLGADDILMEGLLDLLTPHETEILTQVAVSRAPMRSVDLAFALDGEPAIPSDELLAATEQLVDLTLFVGGPQIVMHRWTADLVNTASPPSRKQHQQALAMRWHRNTEGLLTYDDLLEIPRHLAALGRYDELSDFAASAAAVLPGVLSRRSFLAELVPLIPTADWAWVLVAEQELHTLVAVGDLRAAAERGRAIHGFVVERAATDPTNSEWQRDLSISHNKLGDLARAAGDSTAARTAYQASLDIAARLAAADPTNTEWQRDLSVSHNKLGDLARAAGDLTAARTAYQASLDIAARLAAADPTNTEWQRDLSVSHNKLGDLAARPGT